MTDIDKSPLLLDHMDADPIKQFVRWFHEAEQAKDPMPNAMTLATSDLQRKPSARMVLLKGVDARGFLFFTNYASRKALELEENPTAALLFYWPSLSRQVRVEGSVERLEADESDSYFASRPRGHQIAAHASQQSQVVDNREFLVKQFDSLCRKFAGKVVPRPLHWGGYRVVPEALEFWQEGESRLHDRLSYRRDKACQWVIKRLAP